MLLAPVTSLPTQRDPAGFTPSITFSHFNQLGSLFMAQNHPNTSRNGLFWLNQKNLAEISKSTHKCTFFVFQ